MKEIKEIIKELNELKDKEMTLLELDNKTEEICESASSLFDDDLYRDVFDDDLKSGSYSYYLYTDPYVGNKEILIVFDIIELNMEDDESNENLLNTIVKLRYVEEI